MSGPTAIVSACLLGVPCRHDGRDKRHEETLRALESRGLSIVPICPEVAGGLPIPRSAAFVEHSAATLPDDAAAGRGPLEGIRVIDRGGRDVTAELSRGAEQALEAARRFGATLAVLKQNSPSCGTRAVGGRDGRIAGEGVTARRLREAGLAVRGEDELAALRDDGGQQARRGGTRGAGTPW